MTARTTTIAMTTMTIIRIRPGPGGERNKTNTALTHAENKKLSNFF